MRPLRGAPAGRATVIAMVAAGSLVLLLVGAFAWRSWTRAPYERAVAADQRGDRPAALAALEQGLERPGLEALESELFGLLALQDADLETARTYLARSREAGGAGSERARPLEEHAGELMSAGRAQLMPALIEHARQVADPLPAPLVAHEGFWQQASGDLVGARESYRAALAGDLDGELARLVERQLGLAAEQSRSGRIPWLVARGGEALAWRDARTRELIAGPELQALLGGADPTQLPGLSEADAYGLVELTLDADLQRRAARVYRSERGAFVALSIPDGEILAAASELQPEVPLAPFAARYQPGSTLKVLTMGAWLDEGLPDDLVVPYDCHGNDFVVDGEILYDWAAHGSLPSLERALSQSCNTVFARMGQELGEHRLREALRPLGFGASLEEGLPSDEGEGFEHPSGESFGTGALAAGPLDQRRLARTAMGLDETRVSPLQAAVVSLTLASGGEYLPPRLIRRRLNVLGQAIPAPEFELQPVRVFSAESAGRVAAAMETVVTDPDGTGRGARTAGIPIGLKTGTTGGDGNPLSSAFVGILPADSPEIAIGMFTRESGRSLDVSRRVLGPFLKDAWKARSPAVRSN